jgi:hypothetical protein
MTRITAGGAGDVFYAKMFHVKHRANGRRRAAWDGSPPYAKMFHVKHRRADPEHAILQNNPMH